VRTGFFSRFLDKPMLDEVRMWPFRAVPSSSRSRMGKNAVPRKLPIGWRHSCSASPDTRSARRGMGRRSRRTVSEFGYTDLVVRHLSNDQPKVLGSLERLAAVHAVLA
jgi:hypothetical protein